MNNISNYNNTESDELHKLDESFKRTEDEGISNTIKYFDRLHDKLFNLNNLMIAAYIAIIVLPNIKASMYCIIIPFINMIILLYIDYRMLKNYRIQSNITKLNYLQIMDLQQFSHRTNLISLFSIVTTLITIIVFLIQLLNYF